MIIGSMARAFATLNIDLTSAGAVSGAAAAAAAVSAAAAAAAAAVRFGRLARAFRHQWRALAAVGSACRMTSGSLNKSFWA